MKNAYQSSIVWVIVFYRSIIWSIMSVDWPAAVGLGFIHFTWTKIDYNGGPTFSPQSTLSVSCKRAADLHVQWPKKQTVEVERPELFCKDCNKPMQQHSLKGGHIVSDDSAQRGQCAQNVTSNSFDLTALSSHWYSFGLPCSCSFMMCVQLVKHHFGLRLDYRGKGWQTLILFGKV